LSFRILSTSISFRRFGRPLTHLSRHELYVRFWKSSPGSDLHVATSLPERRVSGGGRRRKRSGGSFQEKIALEYVVKYTSLVEDEDGPQVKAVVYEKVFGEEVIDAMLWTLPYRSRPHRT
jgi:hypothetical protein